ILHLPGKNWYPESFQGMIQAKRIDPAKMSERYRFVLDTEAQRVGITLENTALSWTYTGISKAADGMYHFVGTPVALRMRGADEIAVQFAGADGKQRAQTFIALDEDIAQLVQEERARRAKELERVRMLGPSFVSSNYGRLQFMEGGAFFWSGYQLLVPTIVAQSAGNGGTVGVQYFISNALKNSYDGILSFRFSGMTKDVHFLYKLTDDGLRLEDATHAQIANGVVTGRGTSPLVIFFSHSTEH
ncbi:MAG: SH3 domain-containing protein, partial [Treponemataceae bacterium]|nr:SH3 domain-containing protein [Treponemataceae bacterium]